jgi:DNA-binding NarL/FixJ family response regulator
MRRVVVVVVRAGLFAKGLSAALNAILPDHDVLLASVLSSARHQISPSKTPELALIDVDVPDFSWASLRTLRCLHPRMRLLAMCDNANRGDAIRCLKSGLSGCFSKTQPVEEIVEAIKDVLSGRFYAAPTVREPKPALSASLVPGSDPTVPLTSESHAGKPRRQGEILALIPAGMSNRDIARELHIAEDTTKIHASSLLRILGVPKRTEADAVGRQYLHAIESSAGADLR